MSNHIVQTTHIQQLITEGLKLSMLVNQQGQVVKLGEDHMLADLGGTVTIDALSRASNLLRHAAEELEDERQRLLGWP